MYQRSSRDFFHLCPYSSVRQAAIASSPRSRPRRSGFWCLHPIPLRVYTYTPDGIPPQTPGLLPGLRASGSTNRSGDRLPSRLSRGWLPVPSSVSAVSLGERHGWGLARKASSPPSFSCCFHDRGVGKTDRMAHFANAFALQQRPAASHAAHLQCFCTTFGSHGSYQRGVPMTIRRSIVLFFHLLIFILSRESFDPSRSLSAPDPPLPPPSPLPGRMVTR